MNEPISPSDPMVILAGIRQFGLASDGSDLRDLEAAFARAAVLPPAPAGVENMREAAAKVADYFAKTTADTENSDNPETATMIASVIAKVGRDIGAAIRALPLPAVPPAADIDETAKAIARPWEGYLGDYTRDLRAAIATALRDERERPPTTTLAANEVADIEGTAAKVAGQHYAKLVQVFGAKAILDADPTVIDALIASFVTALRAERERGTEQLRYFSGLSEAEHKYQVARADAAEAELNTMIAGYAAIMEVVGRRGDETETLAEQVRARIEAAEAQVRTLREALKDIGQAVEVADPYFLRNRARAALATKEPT